MDRVDQLAAELDAFHRGRGFHEEGVTERLGPALAAIVFGDNDPDPATGRDLLQRWLIAASKDLPEDLLEVFQRASGLRDSRAFLKERLDPMVRSTGFSHRTLIRRLREADKLVAAALVARSENTEDKNPYAVSGWYVDRLDSVAHLDRQRPRFDSLREIIATHTGVEQICESWSIPRPAQHPLLEDLELEATAGCRITEIERITPSTWRVTVDLDQTLVPRQRFRIGFAVTLPSRVYVRPFNAFVPVRRTRSFRSEVRYDESTGLTGAWRFDGIPPMAMDDAVPIGEHLALDGTPLVAEWKTVRRGLAYGIGWSW